MTEKIHWKRSRAIAQNKIEFEKKILTQVSISFLFYVRTHCNLIAMTCKKKTQKSKKKKKLFIGQVSGGCSKCISSHFAFSQALTFTPHKFGTRKKNCFKKKKKKKKFLHTVFRTKITPTNNWTKVMSHKDPDFCRLPKVDFFSKLFCKKIIVIQTRRF